MPWELLELYIAMDHFHMQLVEDAKQGFRVIISRVILWQRLYHVAKSVSIDDQLGSANLPTYTIVHAVFMMFAWSFLIPFGVFNARYLRGLVQTCPLSGKEAWFDNHRFANTAAVTLAIAAFLVMIIKKGSFVASYHSIIGMVVFGCSASHYGYSTACKRSGETPDIQHNPPFTGNNRWAGCPCKSIPGSL